MVGISKCPVCNISFKWYRAKKDKPGIYCSKKCMNTMVKSWNSKGRFLWRLATAEEKLQRIRDRFEKFVIKQDGCWDWKGCTHGSGYVVMKFYDRKQKNGHIVSWILSNGTIPDGLFVLHKCDNKKCTNPEHLFLGTLKDNAIDREKKNRSNRPFGENHKNSKLTVDKVKEIKTKLAMGVTMKRLAEDFMMSQGALAAIKNNITWKNVIV